MEKTSGSTAKIYVFPVKRRAVETRFAEQVRMSRELAAKRAAARIAPMDGWYHDDAIAEQHKAS